MRTRFVAGSFVVGVSLSFIMLWLMNGLPAAVISASAGELHVCLSGCPYSSVQAAVDAASDGDVIKVAAGTYTGVSTREGATQVAYISKSVTIQGGYTTGNWSEPDPEANVTTLDAQGQGRVLFVIGGSGSVIDGFHLTGGDAFGQPGSYFPSVPDGSAGGGVYVHGSVDPFGAEFTLTNNHIYGNTARQGGGVYMSFCCSDATFRGNTFYSNSAENDGGGVLLHAGAAELIGNVFDSNSADRGGGGYMSCNGTQLDRNTFVANTADSAGGGIFLNMMCSEAMLIKNLVMLNTAARGGGLAITGGDAQLGKSATLINTVIADNQASIEGGGMYVVAAHTVRLLHTTLARNGGGDGSGVRVGDFALEGPGPSTVFLTNTIVANQDVGIHVEDNSTVTVNNILWHNTPITISQSLSAIVLAQNQHVGDPLFLDPNVGGFHIGSGSAAIDEGVIAGVATDLDDEPRFGIPDMGADEYWAPGALKRVCLPMIVTQ